jgi:hypothetical protein
MIRSAASKVMWVGRATVFLVGLAVILALLFGVASAALGANGNPLILGKAANTASKITGLVKSGEGPALRLKVDSGPPLAVDSDAQVANLNADLVDGMHANDLETSRGYAHVTLAGNFDSTYPSKGVNDVLVPEGKPAVYCFDLTFTPVAAVGSPHLNNSAVIGTVTPPNDAIVQNCPATHRDAAAHTYGSSTGADAAINFQIIFE